MNTIPIELEEWQTLSPLDCESLSNVNLEGHSSARRIAAELTSSGRFELQELLQGIKLRTSSYVGRLILGPLSITIRPKLRGAPLLTLLRYAYALRNFSLYDLVHYAKTDFAFQDLLIYQFSQEMEELLRRGIHREYERRADLLSSPRGRIDMNSYARSAQHTRTRLPVLHYPRLSDTLINRVLRAGISLSTSLTDEMELKARLRGLDRILSMEVRPIQLNTDVLLRAERQLDRRTSAYLPSFRIIKMLFDGSGIDFDEVHAGVRLPGMLFDMNRFFQMLISRFFHEHLEGYVVEDEYRLKNLFSYDPDYNPKGKKLPKLRPDFIIKKDGAIVAILDAKYRDLWEKDFPSYMLYQLSLYALSRNECDRAVILYPTLSEFATEQHIAIHEPLYGTGRAKVILRPVKLLYLENLLRDEHTADNWRRRVEFAKWMVFGD
ncbi:MAG: restriction endonuclease [Spirochaetia bacterium]|nr:restriction endonuclease [Spirochaetia bacterium]